MAPPPPPPAPARVARTKARPPRLIYPKRNEAERPGEVFVARLTIDAEGFVVGVKLEQGIGGRADEHAATAVWRFRYDPARDDAGKPVRSKVEQRFMLDR
jgi:hypothetical protein